VNRVDGGRWERVLHDPDIPADTLTYAGSGLANGTYRAWIRAWDGSVPSPWSDPFEFKVT